MLYLFDKVYFTADDVDRHLRWNDEGLHAISKLLIEAISVELLGEMSCYEIKNIFHSVCNLAIA